jgi:hypothetical protein
MILPSSLASSSMSFYHFYHIKALAKFVKSTLKKKVMKFFQRKKTDPPDASSQFKY